MITTQNERINSKSRKVVIVSSKSKPKIQVFKESLSLSKKITKASSISIITHNSSSKHDKEKKHKKGMTIVSSSSITNTTAGHNSKELNISSNINYQVETPINLQYKQYLVSKRLFSSSTAIPTDNSSSILAIPSTYQRDLFKKEKTNKLYIETSSELDSFQFPLSARSHKKESLLSHGGGPISSSKSKKKSKSKILNYCKNTKEFNPNSMTAHNNQRPKSSLKPNIMIGKPILNLYNKKLEVKGSNTNTAMISPISKKNSGLSIASIKLSTQRLHSAISLEKSHNQISLDIKPNNNMIVEEKPLISAEALKEKLQQLSARMLKNAKSYSDLNQKLYELMSLKTK